MYGGWLKTIALALTGAGCSLMVASAAHAATEPIHGLHVTGVTPSAISLAWDSPASSHGQFAVWVLGPAPGGATGDTSPRERAADTSTTVGGLVCGSLYTVQVAWTDPGEQPEPSASLQTATAACTRPPPSAPSGLRADPSDTDIVFTWDAQPFTVSAVVALAGPGMAGGGGVYGTRYDPRTVVCGETYTLTVYWIDDEGLRSPDATLSAAALDCPPTVDAGPDGLRVVSSSWNMLTYGWAPYGAPGLWLVRTTSTGGPPYRYLPKTTLSESFQKRLCGTAYPLTVQWVFTDGTVSSPSTLNGSTAACVLATVTTGEATGVESTTASLGGIVMTNGSDTLAHVEYGTAPDYGMSTTTSTITDHGTEPRGVRIFVGGLMPGTTYHYRLVATNTAGISAGADRTFTTTTRPPPATVTPPLTTPAPLAQPRTVCTVPALKRLRLHAAKLRLARAHCRLGKLTRRHTTRSRRGTVLASTPRAGTRTTGTVALVVGR